MDRLAALMARHGIDRNYPEAVTAETEAWLASPGIDDPSLDDLTAVPFCTVDNEGSRDLDQALHVERSGRSWLLSYALADASYYVRPGSALFAEALRRGTSAYLPGFSVPMLPPQLSEGLISLNEGVDRRAVVFEIRVSPSGKVTDRRVRRARIRSRARLTYAGVQAFADAPAVHPLGTTEVASSLLLLRELGEARQAAARRRGVVAYDRNETLVMPPATPGGPYRVILDERVPASGWNEQLSLLVNIEGARILADGRDSPHVQAVFRIHEGPSKPALGDLERQIRALARAALVDPDLWCWRRRGRAGRPPESLADYLDRLPRAPATAGLRTALERMVLLTNQRSQFTAEPGLHYGLGVTPYCRFSAPMREVVGIFTHKELLEHLGFQPPEPDADDEALREAVIASANEAGERNRRLEREILELAVDDVLAPDLALPRARRPRRQALLLGSRPGRCYVRLHEPPLELKVYLDPLEARLGLACSAEGPTVRIRSGGAETVVRSGDTLRLWTLDRDEERLRWLLAPLDPAEGAP